MIFILLLFITFYVFWLFAHKSQRALHDNADKHQVSELSPGSFWPSVIAEPSTEACQCRARRSLRHLSGLGRLHRCNFAYSNAVNPDALGFGIAWGDNPCDKA